MGWQYDKKVSTVGPIRCQSGTCLNPFRALKLLAILIPSFFWSKQVSGCDSVNNPSEHASATALTLDWALYILG